MAMLRSIYSTGSHTNHNLILLSQTVLCEDLDLSSNDKGNFIQICIGSLSGDYLALRRGKANKKRLYERLAACTEQYEFYATYEDYKGIIDINPLPDLERYGAKRLYNGQSDHSNTAVLAVSSGSGSENNVSEAVLTPSSAVSLSDTERLMEQAKLLYTARDLEIAMCIIRGMNKTNTREKVGGNAQATGKRYDEIYAELQPVSYNIKDLKTGGQQ